jgi:integrase
LGSRSIEILRAHHQRQLSESQKAENRWHDFGLIFTNSNGDPIDPRNLIRDFKKLFAMTDLPKIRFHDLRHTAALLMLNNNIPILVVTRILGHSRPSITLDVYGHLIPSAQADIGEKLDALITPIEIQGCTGLHQIGINNR